MLFRSSLYSSYGIAGIETLGDEIAKECNERYGKYPEAVIATHAGGGNVTGTARGLIKAGALNTKIIGASVDLSGLHMASDIDFNKKSFTTGHTGFGIPFITYPDRSDVPRSAARPLRYLDRYVTITQGEVFWMTEILAQIEGLERGPAGNTSLSAAFSISQEYEDDAIIIVQETEYTGAGKHLIPQLNFAKENGIKVFLGDPKEQVPGKNIVIPSSPFLVSVKDVDMDNMRSSYIKNMIKRLGKDQVREIDIEFLSKETKMSKSEVSEILRSHNIEID